MEQKLPAAFAQLLDTMRRLEEHYRDMQDIEFTVEDNELYLLQTRSAKRTAAAAVKAAVEMAEEGLITREDAVARIDPDAARAVAASDDRSDRRLGGRHEGPERLAGRGLRGDRARRGHGRAARQGGESVILVRWETTPDDIHGLIQAAGILTAHGA